MGKAYLTRRVTFAAAHRYRRMDWTDEKNQEIFGPCSWPSYHGHSYTCDVTVTGEIDPLTGFLIDLGELDRILLAEVRTRFDHRNINVDVQEFGDDGLVPTGENLSRFIFEKVQAALPATVEVTCVKIAEDDTLSASWQRE
ncbi:MAG TPA: 6-carboxytetrahydropterin synthase [Gemmatimonadaceae bacterium]|nr:6-carboxytetrahydropterin synthase [Gemmatimonadaceae bacterium]